MRSVLDTFMQWKTADGLIEGPTGWNFMDWVKEWPCGMPPDGDVGGISGVFNFQLAWVFEQAAALEDTFGEPEFAALRRRHAHDLTAAAVDRFWTEERGLFADDLKRTRFSEHTQCMALLGNAVDARRRPRVIDNLFTDDRLSRHDGLFFALLVRDVCV